MSEETFLESFIGESLATLPHEMRRSMELVKDLDQRGRADWRRLLALQHQFLQQAEETVLTQLQVVELMPEDDDEKEVEEEEGANNPFEDDDIHKDDHVQLNESKDKNNSNKKRKKGSNQQQLIEKQPKKKYGVLVLKSDGTSYDPEDYNPDTDAVIPTTDELFQLITSRDRIMPSNSNSNKTSASSNITTYSEIRRLQRACWQTADEKVAVARQAWERLDAQVQRLDADLRALETQLSQQHGPDWAAAMLSMGLTSSSAIGSSSNNINNNSSMNNPNAATTSTGKPNDLVACQVTPGSEWILAKIILHDPVTGNYKLADEDSESNKIFDLPGQQVIVLMGNDLRLSKGDAVYAIYPDTTSFYPAHVVQAPRKQNTALQQYVMVTFVDDSDEFGITHDKAVPLQHVMPPPYDA